MKRQRLLTPLDLCTLAAPAMAAAYEWTAR